MPLPCRARWDDVRLTSLLGGNAAGLELTCGRNGALEPLEKDMEGEPERELGLELSLREDEDSVDNRFIHDDDRLAPSPLYSKESGRSRVDGCLPSPWWLDCACS